MSRLIVSSIETQNIKFDSDTTAFTIGSDGGIKAEGTNTTNLQQGLIKCWSTVEMDNSNNIPDSFNSSGITDNGSGTPQFTFINSMATVAAYVLAGAGNDATMISEQGAAADARTDSLQTGSIKTRQRAHDAGVADGHVMIMIAGDLA